MLTFVNENCGSEEVPTDFGGEGITNNCDRQEVPPKGFKKIKFEKK